MAVLGGPLVSFGQRGGGAAERLYSATAVLSFVDGAGGVQLGPGAVRLASALQEADVAKAVDVDWRRVQQAVVAALALAHNRHAAGYESLRSETGPLAQRSSAALTRQALAAQAGLPKMAPVSRETVEALSRALTRLAAEQAYDMHQFKEVCEPGAAAAEESRVAALKLSMDQAEDADPMSVGAIVAAKCTFSAACTAMKRRSDSFCAGCLQFEVGAWLCPKCSTLNRPRHEECWMYTCQGKRPAAPPVLPGGRESLAAKAQLAAFAKRDRAEAAAVAARGSGGGGGSYPGHRG